MSSLCRPVVGSSRMYIVWPGRRPAQLRGQLDPLRLAAGERRRRLAQREIAEADVGQRRQQPADRLVVLEELDRLVDAHRQHVGDRLAAISHGERLPIEPRAVAHGARHFQVGQEVHRDPPHALPFALLAAAALGVEAEPADAVAALPGLLGAGEHAADVVPHAGVGGRVRARRAADRRLIDFDQPIELRHAAQALMRRRPRFGAVELARERRGQRVDHQRALARAAHAGDADEQPQRNLDVDVLQIVRRRAGELQHPRLRRLASLGRQRNRLPARKIAARERSLQSGAPRPACPAATTVPAAAAGAGADVDQIVARPHQRFVVLDHDHRVALLLQIAQRGDQPVVVARMQADRRLVEQIQHADQPRADAGRQPHALPLAAAERVGRPIEREILGADAVQETPAAARSRPRSAWRSSADRRRT